MTMQNMFVLTAAQRTTAMGWNNEDVMIEPLAVDNASPGVGLNLNDNAVDYEPADPVTLTATYVAPKCIVDDPDYLTYAPAMITFLLTLPWCSLVPHMAGSGSLVPGDDRATWRPDFVSGETPERRAAAEAVIASFNPEAWPEE